jgi:hypothetical protein
MPSEFQPGQPVMWRHEMRGGYAYVEYIPGVVVRVTPQQVTIRVNRRDGSAVERSVKPEHLKPRA